LRDELFRRNIYATPAYWCLRQTGVFGSALRAHFISAPAAEAGVAP